MTFYQFSIRPNPLPGPTERVLTGISVTLFPCRTRCGEGGWSCRAGQGPSAALEGSGSASADNDRLRITLLTPTYQGDILGRWTLVLIYVRPTRVLDKLVRFLPWSTLVTPCAATTNQDRIRREMSRRFG
jgi:hypothetical protein